MNIFKHPPRVLFSLLLTFAIGGVVSGQTSFDLKPIAPSETVSTWVDFLGVSYQLHLRLPPTVKIEDSKTDITEQHSFVISRAVKVLNTGLPGRVLQVNYIPTPPGASLPSPVGGEPVHLTAPLEGRSFQIRCDDESVVDVTGGRRTPLTKQEASIIQRECRELLRNQIKERFFSDMKVGESKELSASDQFAMLSEDLTELGLVNSVVTLERIEALPPSNTATFAVRSTVKPNTALGGLFGDCAGTLNTDSRGLLTELRLKCVTKSSSDILPNEPEVKAEGEMNLVFFRRILGI